MSETAGDRGKYGMQAEIDRLRAALEEIANSTWVAQTCPEAAQIARKALEDGK